MADLLQLRTLADLDRALAGSAERPLVLLKHSTRCPTSARAHAEFLGFACELPAGEATPAVILVVEDRPVSDRVAAALGVRHESPQAIVVRAGRAVWDASHDDVTRGSLRQALAGVAA